MKSVAIFIYNQKNEILLQKRSKNEKDFPLHWDFSAAGDIEFNEEIHHAACRELKEELGIKADLKFIKLIPIKDSEIYVFKGIYNQSFKTNQEVEEVKFFKREQVYELISNHEKFHPEFLEIFNLLHPLSQSGK